METLDPQWARLYEAAHTHNVFLHPAWCLSFMDCYRPLAVRVLVEAGSSGQVEALVALAGSGPGSSQWSTLGAPFVDFGTPLVAPCRDAAEALANLLHAHRSEWSSVTLDGVDESFAHGMIIHRRHPDVEFRAVGSEVCPRIEVPSFEAWAGSLPRGRWKRLAAARRRIERCPGYSYRLIDEPADIGRAVRSFDALRLQSWWNRDRLHELARPVRSALHGTFLGLAAVRMAAAGAASVVELRISERLVASAVLFWTSTSVLVALKATDTRLGSSMSPGLALDVFTIELAARRSVTWVEFGRGDEGYKFFLGAQPRRTHRVIATKPGARLPLLRNAMRRELDRAAYTWRMRRSS